MFGSTARPNGADQPPSTHGTFAGRARSWPVRVAVIALLGVGIAAPVVAAEPASSPVITRIASHSLRGTVPSARSRRIADAVPASPITLATGPTAAEKKKLADAVLFITRVNQNRWISAVHANQVAQLAAAQAQAAQAARQAAAAKVAAAAPSGRCGGNLPPCYVMMRESRGNIRARNPSSSASGKWQFIDSTWAGFGGYAEAWQAPESVQDAKAAQLWAGGAGCGHWNAC